MRSASESTVKTVGQPPAVSSLSPRPAWLDLFSVFLRIRTLKIYGLESHEEKPTRIYRKYEIISDAYSQQLCLA